MSDTIKNEIQEDDLSQYVRVIMDNNTNKTGPGGCTDGEKGCDTTR